MENNKSNLITIITSLAVIIMITAGIMLHEEPEYISPSTVENNIIWIDLKNDSLDIWMRSEEPVYGIQFEFEGIKISKSDGGYLNLEGFNTSHNESMVLSFSFEGKSIPPGEFMLLSLDITYTGGKSGASISNLVVAGQGGTALDFGYFNLNSNTIVLRSTH